MAKLRVLSGKEVCNILSNQSSVEVRKKGSHIVMQSNEAGKTITVPVPNHTELRIGTLQSIIRQSGVPRNKFEVQK